MHQSDDAENVRVGDLVAFIEETNWLRLRAEQNFEHLRAYAMAVNESPEKERTDA